MRERVVGALVVAQLLELFDGLGDADGLASLLRGRVVAVADVDLTAFHLLGADD